MVARALLLGLFSAAITLAAETPQVGTVVQPPKSLKLGDSDRVISTSEQFRISGGEPSDRSAIALIAEEAKSELLRLTEEKDAWKVPVTITLHGKPGDPVPLRTVATQILVSEVGYELRVDLHLCRGIERERFKQTATSALIYERALRDRKTHESETPFLVPPWLTDGLCEATAWLLNQSDRRLYAALFKTGGLFKIDELFALNQSGFEELDAATRTAFRTSSGALVMALLQQPHGKEGFSAFLTDAAAFQGEMPALLRKHFPELNLSETSLSKWWALQFANIGGQNLTTDVLSIAQTETALADALKLNVRTPEGIFQSKDLSSWPELASLSDLERAKAVETAQEALVRLSYRCFPSFRPILGEYDLVLKAIAKNTTKDLAARITSLDERRATMSNKARHARDYLDWFEITRARQTSGAFDDYIRLKERLKVVQSGRSDSVSKYLDRMDAIFSRKDAKATGER
jgi:hypothetical protein